MTDSADHKQTRKLLLKHNLFTQTYIFVTVFKNWSSWQSHTSFFQSSKNVMLSASNFMQLINLANTNKTRYVFKVHRCPGPMAFAHMTVSFGHSPTPSMIYM